MPFAILVAALLAPASAPAPPAFGGAWTLWRSEDGRDYFVDAGGTPDAGGVIRFRIRLVVRAPSAESLPYPLAIADFRIDCRRQTIAMGTVTTYKASGAVNTTETAPHERSGRDPIYAGSENEKFYLRYCPASIRRPLSAPPPPPVFVTMPPPMAPPVPPPPPRPMAPPPPPPPPPNAVVEKARPLAPLASLFTEKDYPSAALRAEEEGVVGYRLTIGRDGRVTHCTVTSSSGSVSLDNVTCRLVTERARFRPARNAKGRRVVDSYSARLIWRIADDEPEPPPVPPPQ